MTAAEGARGRPVAQVLLDSALPQLDHLFDYAVPGHLADDIRLGQRVRVPFRSQNRRSHGYVIGFAERSDFGGELQPIAEIVSPVPQLTPEVWRLARAVSDRAGGSASDILRLAVPQRMVRAEKQHLAQLAAAHAMPVSAKVAEGSAVETKVESFVSAPTDAAPAGNLVSATEAADHETAELLVAGGRLAITPSHGPERLATGEWVGGFAARLARIAVSVHAAGRSVILVAPDYRDVDQLADALFSLGHEDPVRVDSRQSGSARYAAFLRALDAEPRIVLGNRSAIYAPAHRLGAVLMWDDADPLLAEPLTPYVHARDAALVRAATEYPVTVREDAGQTEAKRDDAEQALPERVGLLFASHARSIEVQRLVEIGYVQPETVPPRRTRVIAAEAVQHGEALQGRVPDFAARVIREGLSAGPVLVQVATPGYAPIATCGECGERARCRACGGPIGFRGRNRPVCRWCGEQAGGWRCGQCGSGRLEQRGMGSERTVEQFQRQFPGVRVVLSDGDHPHERVDSRPALVVATRGAEPIAAGGYRAVVLLDAERLLGIESLRAAEDCLRWWQNAAALAAPDGRCVLASGGGPVVQAFVTGRVEDWLRAELHERQQLRYPPAVRVASVTGGAAEVDRALRALGHQPGSQPAHGPGKHAGSELPGVDVLGPAPYQPRQSGAPGGGVAGGPQANLVRAIVRFDYVRGAEVAKRLRGALVADAAGSSSRVGGRVPGRARPEALRLRFDDRGVFDA